MTIKTKLTMNVLLVLLIIAAVAGTSFVGMSFVRSRLTDLTERSTPFQMRTVEFQRTIQAATADLVKVSSSRHMDELSSYRTDVEKSLKEVKTAQEALESISGGGKIETFGEIKDISGEIIQVSLARINAEAEAKKANEAITQKMKNTSERLNELDKKIQALQLTRSAAFVTSMEDTGSISANLRNAEAVKSLLKDLQIALFELHRAQDKRGVIIARSKINSIMSRFSQEDYLKSNRKAGDEIRAFWEKLDELIRLRSSADSDLKAIEALTRDVDERLSVIVIELEQEVAAAREKAGLETEKQGGIMTQSNVATAVLMSNSRLLADGLTIEGLTTRLFTLTAQKDVDTTEAHIRKTFEKIDASVNTFKKGLAKLKDNESLKVLHEVEASLMSVKALLFAKDGVVSKIRHQISMRDKALQVTDNLRQIVIRQAEKGKKTVSTARGEQEKTIGAVNRMIRFSTTIVVVIGICAASAGIMLGFWIYRSIERPLIRLISTADEMAKGNLTGETKAGTDEMGRLSESMNHMVRSFSGIIGKIIVSVNKSVQVLNNLRSLADQSAQGAGEQSDQSYQIATAAEEMNQTIHGISKNASVASDTSAEAMNIAAEGRKVADGAVETVNRVYVSTGELSVMMEKLNGRVAEIGDIVTVIKDIADQTNLLALNAAIEAARAGEQGMGFAVVADEVRKLAEKTIKATAEISAKISGVQSESERTARHMGDASHEVKRAFDNIKQVGDALNNIVEAVQKVSEQITQIAVAVEEQSATASDVAKNSEKTSAIAGRQKESSAAVIKDVSGLIEVIEELRGSTVGFKVNGNELMIVDLAKSDHQLFVNKIGACIRGRLEMDFSQLPDHHSCRFGKWYDTEGRDNCGNLPSFQAVYNPHERVHALAREAGNACRAGDKARALSIFEEMEGLSVKIVGLLDGIKREYRRTG
ncbi:MAG: CZB domain-containing protein [Nitrospirae bacterium]|nr:CZB domain-containing protein [Nitrospirota bacterium]